MGNQRFGKGITKHTGKVTTLGSMTNVVKVDKQSVKTDTFNIFPRVLVISGRYRDIQGQFEYELAPIST